MNKVTKEVEQAVAGALGTALQVDPASITQESTIDSLDLDSLGWLETEVELRGSLGVKMDRLGRQQFRTVRELSTFVEAAVEATGHHRPAGLTRVQVAEIADVEDITAVLTDGFSEDPLMTWIFETPEQYAELAPQFFRWMTTRTVAIGTALFVPGQGAVLGQPAATVEVSASEQMELQSQLRHVGGGASDRLLAFMNAAGAHHPLNENHWYGTFQAVRKEYRSDGIGDLLFERLTTMYQMPIYCESTTDRNRDYWSKNGFEVIGRFSVSSEIELNQMWRVAR